MWQFLPESGGYHPDCAIPPVDPSLPCKALVGDHSYPVRCHVCGDKKVERGSEGERGTEREEGWRGEEE